MTRPNNIRGAHAFGVLVGAFCDDELSSAFGTSLVLSTPPSSFRQHAETSRLEPCAPLTLPFTR